MASKKILQDIVPSTKRSIKNVKKDIPKKPIENTPEISIKEKEYKIPLRNKIIPDIEEKIEKNEVFERVDTEKEYIKEKKYLNSIKESEINKDHNHKNKKHKKTGAYIFSFIVICLCIITIGIALSLSYSKAVITITPKILNFDINGTFTAKKNAQSEELSYEVISLSEEAIQSIPATAGPLVQTKAKGTVILYNNYSNLTQKIIAGTRLANVDGLIYRTISSVTIPGKKIVQNKNIAGSVEITVSADTVGSDYNMQISDLKGDFKFIGYKGTDKYDGFYGRLKTDIVGGFSGNKILIASSTKNIAILSMQESLKQSLLSKLKSVIPDGYILYENAYSLDYENKEPIMKDKENANISTKAFIYGAIIKSDLLIQSMAGKELKKFPSETYNISGDKELEFKISNIKDFSIKKGSPMIFSLKGPILITGNFIENDLKNSLKGINLKDSPAIFAKYPAIANAHTLITPFWLRYFPSTPEKILIEYKP